MKNGKMSFMKMLKNSRPKVEPSGLSASFFFPFTKRLVYFATLKSVFEIAFHKKTLSYYPNDML